MFNFKEKRANNGDINAIIDLMNDNINVQDFPKSKPDFIKWALKGAELKSPEALFYLAKAHELGVHTPLDEQKAFECMKQSVDIQSDSPAAYQLGVYYINGIGTPKDINKAYDLAQVALKNNHPSAPTLHEFISKYLALENKAENNEFEAMRELLQYYVSDVPLKDSNPKALEYAQKLVDLNDPLGYGHLQLARFYAMGIHVPKDSNKFFELSLKADQLNPTMTSQFNLAYAYFYGDGVEKDLEKSLSIIHDYSSKAELSPEFSQLKDQVLKQVDIEQQANQGDLNALNELLNFYRPERYEHASNRFIELVKRAKTENLANGYFYDAKLSELGIKRAVNYQDAFDAMNRSFQIKPQIGPALNLAYYYEKGLGVDMDFKKAYQFSQYATDLGAQGNEKALAYYKQVSDLEDKAMAGDNAAMVRVLNIYRGDKLDNASFKFTEFARIGAVRNHPYSLAYYGKCYEMGIHVPKDSKQAFDLMEKSYLIDRNGLAAINLGYYYCQGFGVEQDYLKAYDYVKEAAQKNHYLNGLEFFIRQKLQNPDDISQFEKETIQALEVQLYQKYYQQKPEQRNYQEILPIVEKLIALGSSDAMNLAGYLYTAKIEGLAYDPEKALAYFKEAAQLHNEVAIRNLAWIHESLLVKDFDKETSYQIAYNHMKEALEYGNDKAYLGMARYCFYGVGTPQNTQQARVYLEKVRDKKADEYLKLKEKIK